MKMKMNVVLAAALSVLAVGGAQAAVSSSTTGNSSLLFVATDSVANIQFVADLGLSFSDMLQNSALIAARQNVSWDFSANTSSLAGVTGNEWSAAYASFKSAATAGNLQWAVIAGDGVNGGAFPGRGLMATGNVTVDQMLDARTTAPTGTGLGNLGNFISASANLPGSTMNSANNGASVHTGAAPTIASIGAMSGTFGAGALTWNYLVANGVSSTFQYQQQGVTYPGVQAGTPVVFQIGKSAASAFDTLNADPLTFTFDIATNQLVAAIPEPSTYALMVAGLVGVGLMARRRRG